MVDFKSKYDSLLHDAVGQVDLWQTRRFQRAKLRRNHEIMSSLTDANIRLLCNNYANPNLDQIDRNGLHYGLRNLRASEGLDFLASMAKKDELTDKIYKAVESRKIWKDELTFQPELLHDLFFRKVIQREYLSHLNNEVPVFVLDFPDVPYIEKQFLDRMERTEKPSTMIQKEIVGKK